MSIGNKRKRSSLAIAHFYGRTPKRSGFTKKKLSLIWALQLHYYWFNYYFLFNYIILIILSESQNNSTKIAHIYNRFETVFQSLVLF